jgi:hypothetical protein
MKRLWFATLAPFVLVILVPWVFASPTETTTVRVWSGPPGMPQPTGVRVAPGDALTITAPAESCWYHCTDRGAIGPNGNFEALYTGSCISCDSPQALYNQGWGAVLPNIAFGSLIGAVADSSGPATEEWWTHGTTWLLDDGLDVNLCSSKSGEQHGVPGGFGPGFVGSNFSARVPADVEGEIFLSMNDFPPILDNTGSLPVQIDVTRSTSVDGAPLRFFMSVLPNPAHNQVAIVLGTPTAERADLTVHDVAGRLVRTLLSGELPAGRLTVTWDIPREGVLRSSPGIYFITLWTASHSSTARVVFLPR